MYFSWIRLRETGKTKRERGTVAAANLLRLFMKYILRVGSRGLTLGPCVVFAYDSMSAHEQLTKCATPPRPPKRKILKKKKAQSHAPQSTWSYNQP